MKCYWHESHAVTKDLLPRRHNSWVILDTTPNISLATTWSSRKTYQHQKRLGKLLFIVIATSTSRIWFSQINGSKRFAIRHTTNSKMNTDQLRLHGSTLVHPEFSSPTRVQWHVDRGDRHTQPKEVIGITTEASCCTYNIAVSSYFRQREAFTSCANFDELNQTGFLVVAV